MQEERGQSLEPSWAFLAFGNGIKNSNKKKKEFSQVSLVLNRTCLYLKLAKETESSSILTLKMIGGMIFFFKCGWLLYESKLVAAVLTLRMFMSLVLSPAHSGFPFCLTP